MPKTSTSSSCTKWIATPIFVGLIGLFILDFWDAWHTPEIYPFGAEGPAADMWMYDSQSNYLQGSALTIGAIVLALIGVWRQTRSNFLRRLYFAPFAYWVLITVVRMAEHII